MPIITLPRLLLSLLSLVILAAAAYLLWTWIDGYEVIDRDGAARHVSGEGWRLYTAVGLFAWSFLGRYVVLLAIPGARHEPKEERTEGAAVTAPDGSVLHVETVGLSDGPTIILTHGWGLNSTAWFYTRRVLAARFRVVTWDLPGLGRSKAPKDGKLTIDRFAQSLGAVVEAAGSGPVILVGHSIGGMTTQTFWRACPEPLRHRVAGVVLVDTTYENPLSTMWLSPLWRALRWPLIEPMCWLTIFIWPIAWLSSWQGYLSGSNHIAMRLTGFGRYATRGQVDMVARLAAKGSPGIQAKGNLAMFHWSVADTVPDIAPPMLILTGTRDIVTLPAASDVIAGLAPQARVQRIDGAGHMGFMECADLYNEAILEFADAALSSRTAAGRDPEIAKGSDLSI